MRMLIAYFNRQPGCIGGNCLRSHVNMTGTINALSMITKSGIEANKVIVGVASYGRSFKMATAGCTGPMCKFTGTADESYAKKGVCTDTSGYISNAEINLIKEQKGDSVQMWQDSASNSDIMVYDNTEWVA
jgi:chitinase